jgi:hypothetical protein
MPKAKTYTLIYKQLVKWFVKFVWPWIVENIWPSLEEKINELFTKVAADFERRLIEWLEGRNRAKADTAQKKAEEAAARSNSASNDAEAEKQRAVAEVWRQVAEQFRQENEVLKVELNEVTIKSASNFRNALDSLDVENLIEEGEDSSLRLQGSQTVLRLPSPTSKKE